MAKFKKKKSAPTPGNDDSKPKIEENIDIPETENSPPTAGANKRSEERQVLDLLLETTSSITYPAYLKVTTTDSCPFDFLSSKDVILPSSVHKQLP